MKEAADCLVYGKSELRLVCVVLAIEPRPSHVLTKCSVIICHPQSQYVKFKKTRNHQSAYYLQISTTVNKRIKSKEKI